MKLHEVKKGTKAFAKRMDEEFWIPFETTEAKTYHAEQFYEPKTAERRTTEIYTREKDSDPRKFKDIVEIVMAEWVIVKDWDTDWEMLVRAEDVEANVNLPKHDY